VVSQTGTNPVSELLLGSGSSRDRRVGVDGRSEWSDLTTCDINPSHGVDVVWDLEELPWPFADDSFTEIHAYEVLEHLGRQGDAESFFAHFYECWRILAPGGYLAATVPRADSPWAWADPGHRRVILAESLVFLSQEQYEVQVGVTAMSDYRDLWQGDFETVWTEPVGESLYFVLRAKK